MAKRKIKSSSIRKSLMKQLEDKGALLDHFEKLVDDYIYLDEMCEQFKKDIEKKGISYVSISSSGKEYEKDNPSVKLLPQYIRQKQSILKDLGLSTDDVFTEITSDDYM